MLSPFPPLCPLPSLWLQKLVAWWTGAPLVMFHPGCLSALGPAVLSSGCSLSRGLFPHTRNSLVTLVPLAHCDIPLFSQRSKGRAESQEEGPRWMSWPRAEGQCNSAGNGRLEPESWPWLCKPCLYRFFLCKTWRESLFRIQSIKYIKALSELLNPR